MFICLCVCAHIHACRCVYVNALDKTDGIRTKVMVIYIGFPLSMIGLRLSLHLDILFTLDYS